MFKIEIKVHYLDECDNVMISPIITFTVPFKWLRFYDDSIQIFDNIMGDWLSYRKDRLVYLNIEMGEQ